MMNLNDALKRVAVLGAAGKMGSGISLLLLQEMARLEAELTGSVGSGAYRLILVDSNESGLDALRHYLRSQLLKFSEKNIILLRGYYAKNPELVSNEEMIHAFVEGAMDLVHFSTFLESAKEAHLLFEAIIEDVAIKSDVLSQFVSDKHCPYFFTNTSSIPISVLNDKGGLQSRIIGYHFYNPPAVQKLLEVITPNVIDPELSKIAAELAKRLQKIVVHSKDVAGFIGNGQFIREIVFACEKVVELSKTYPLPEAIYLVDKVTRDFLIRPMGIFQLLDYVGINVAQCISRIMTTYLPGQNFQIELVDRMVAAQVIGGQYSDGSQKNGFLEYEHNVPKGVFNLERGGYISFAEGDWAQEKDKLLGSLPQGWLSWKKMQKESDKQEKLKSYLATLFQGTTLGAEIGKAYLIRAREIAQQLVKDGVASKIEDVNTVMENGFFHLYGPASEYIGNRR